MSVTVRGNPGITPLACLAVLSICLVNAGNSKTVQRQIAPSPLTGTWTLVAAERILPDGSHVDDYGAAPKGLLIVDAAGRYSLQIFKAERPRFAAADKAKGTPEEFAAAVAGASTHFGTIELDARAQALVFHISAASFPNWEGTDQTRSYTLDHGELRYRVPPRPDGSVPVSVWRRID